MCIWCYTCYAPKRRGAYMMLDCANCPICGHLTDDGAIFVSGNDENRRYDLICFDCMEKHSMKEISQIMNERVKNCKNKIIS